jgi:hypothetical protein
MYSKITATNKHIMPIIADTIPIALVATPIFALAKVNTVETRKSGATSVGNLEVRRKGTSERKGISEKKRTSMGCPIKYVNTINPIKNRINPASNLLKLLFNNHV